MFRLKQQIDFCYGHRLLNYKGKCGQLHGHNARVEVVLQAEELNDLGMVVDFRELKAKLKGWIDATFDHRVILCERDPVVNVLKELGEPVVVLSENPTAENLAKFIFEEVTAMGLPVVEVTFWETDSSSATYSRSA